MHEMGICQSILSASIDAAAEAGATGIREVCISVGDLTEIQDFALEFAWEALTPGTMAEGGTLTITRIEPRSRCSECGNEYTHDRFEMLCPKCGSMAVQLLQGRELTIDTIETTDDDGAATDILESAPDTEAAAASEE